MPPASIAAAARQPETWSRSQRERETNLPPASLVRIKLYHYGISDGQVLHQTTSRIRRGARHYRRQRRASERAGVTAQHCGILYLLSSACFKLGLGERDHRRRTFVMLMNGTSYKSVALCASSSTWSLTSARGEECGEDKCFAGSAARACV